MKRVILIGKGQVGTGLLRDLKDVEIFQWNGDIAELSSEELARINPFAVINAAGKTDLAWCEANAREAVRSNLEAPVELYRRILAVNPGIRYLHFSSGCVWDGPFDNEGKPFTPESPTSPACLYSWTKAACDALLQEQSKASVGILRPRQVYSDLSSPRNTLTKLKGYDGLIDTPNSMSSMHVIAKTVSYLLNAPDDWQSVWNIYDQGYTTPFHVGVMLARTGLRRMPSVIDKSALDTWHKPKRVDVVMFDQRFEARIKPDTVEHELERAIESYASHLLTGVAG